MTTASLVPLDLQTAKQSVDFGSAEEPRFHMIAFRARPRVARGLEFVSA